MSYFLSLLSIPLFRHGRGGNAMGWTGSCRIFLLVVCGLSLGAGRAAAQPANPNKTAIRKDTAAYPAPQRLNYFPADKPPVVLDPGDEILARNLLITNRFSGGNVSFALSFDQVHWEGTALGADYSSMYSLLGYGGCYVRVSTRMGENRQITKLYYLRRGACYGIFWNPTEGCWDVEANPCRR